MKRGSKREITLSKANKTSTILMICLTSKQFRLSDKSHRFIDAYIICSRCGAPELDLFKYENEEKYGKDLCAICFACGKE